MCIRDSRRGERRLEGNMASLRQILRAWDTTTEDLTIEVEVRDDGSVYFCIEGEGEHDCHNIIVKAEDGRTIAEFLTGKLGRS